mmetsp:Transcript_12678/g.27451  ORF Transcript_12678/g.27451 Transcript_12678/m.27451 type:complete len:272 (+) Transcript_12678:76-891(+)|eukprot:CAMPEP_0202904640 /NCGR_PEP_ID=MMETSP1392-20130828/30440_1 /ASSEMBLY_ACC=CAM_ASM_000868 /TAXON_ID=225041 /ORGANISM="Chlamydomonas chlamydogama, Strain SAG 11-48b" /LENGTH=271 /DNA_ID=CAMNT_0049592379 /DNA_START=42 /DNA_END=857 /DNA_ORIENTATION=-
MLLASGRVLSGCERPARSSAFHGQRGGVERRCSQKAMSSKHQNSWSPIADDSGVASQLGSAIPEQQKPEARQQPCSTSGAHCSRINRRTLGLLAGGIGAVFQSAAGSPASAIIPALQGELTGPTAVRVYAVEDTMQYVYPFASDIPANLRVKEYYDIITRTRPGCWQTIAQQIQSKQYSALESSLTQAPFADLRASAMYMSWALLQADDYNIAVDVRKAYNDINSHVQDLQKIALAAAAGDTGAEPVQQAFILLNASLSSFLALIPPKYLN